MPHYEFYCNACKKAFTKILALVDYEEGGVVCPHCGSHKVEQSWSVFSVITSRKSAREPRPQHCTKSGSLTLAPLGPSLEMSPLATAKLRRTTLVQRPSDGPDLRGHSGSSNS